MADGQEEGGGKMLEIQQKRAPAHSKERFAGERPLPPWVMTQLKKVFAEGKSRAAERGYSLDRGTRGQAGCAAAHLA